jgi:hypothetical protein
MAKQSAPPNEISLPTEILVSQEPVPWVIRVAKTKQAQWLGSLSLLGIAGFCFGQYGQLGGVTSMNASLMFFIVATIAVMVWSWGVAANLPRLSRTAQGTFPFLVLIAAIFVHHVLPPRNNPGGTAKAADQSQPVSLDAAKPIVSSIPGCEAPGVTVFNDIAIGDENDSVALFQLGLKYRDAGDFKRSTYLFAKASCTYTGGNQGAMVNLGESYLLNRGISSVGIPQRCDTAIRWLTLSADAHHDSGAMVDLGDLYDRPTICGPRDPQKSCEWYKKGAHAHNVAIDNWFKKPENIWCR